MGLTMNRGNAQFQEDMAVDVLARTMWGEARGQPKGGMEAVASVVLNRVAVARERGGFWWGNDIISVCQKPFQFSCWNANDPNRAKLMAVDARNMHFATCLRIARRAVNGVLADHTGFATHYHAKSIMPKWAVGKTPGAVIGDHIFYSMPEG